MKKYLSKLLFRALPLTLLIIILIAVIASILLNNFLAASKYAVEQNLSNVFHQKVIIERIAFLPPNFITVKNVSFRKVGLPEESPPIFIEKVKCVFSLSMLIAKRDFVLTKMDFDKTSLDYHFIKENFKEILEAINSLIQEHPIKMGIKKARFNLSNKGTLAQSIALDAVLEIDPGQSIISYGSIGLEGLFIKNDPEGISLSPALASLDYNFRVLLTEKGCMIESLELQSSKFYLKLWGMLEENVLTINGSTSLSDFPDLNIYNLACAIKFEFPSIYIENLSFYLENMPFRLEGAISLSPSPKLNLRFSSFRDQPPEVRLQNPEAFDVNIAGTLRERKYSGTVSLDFLRKTRTKKSWERVETIFENLTFFNTRDGKTEMSFQEATLSYMSGSNLYNILLRNFTALFYLEEKMIKFTKISSIIYDGYLEGRGVLDVSRIPFKSFFDANISNVSANRLHNLLIYCSKIYGNLSSQIHYRGYPNLELSGELEIKNGLLDNLIFFNWVADFLKIPSINRINFDKVSAEFVIDNEGASLKNIHLVSKEVNFDGYFTLHENDLVSSRLSLLLSKGLLKTSSKLRGLLNYMKEDVSYLSFNFQLSGLFQAMNFKWLESDFKKLLQDLLPYRIERQLERATEKIIESISRK